MPRKVSQLDQLKLRKQMLVAESMLNRCQLLESVDAFAGSLQWVTRCIRISEIAYALFRRLAGLLGARSREASIWSRLRRQIFEFAAGLMK